MLKDFKYLTQEEYDRLDDAWDTTDFEDSMIMFADLLNEERKRVNAIKQECMRVRPPDDWEGDRCRHVRLTVDSILDTINKPTEKLNG